MEQGTKRLGSLSYKIILERDLQAGKTLAQVKTRLASLFRSDVSVVERLYDRAPIVLKRGLNKVEVQKYKSTIEKTCALCRVRKEGPWPWPPLNLRARPV